MSDVVMPRLSDSMEEGTILKWLVEPGSVVKRGQEIVEIETDKATMPYEADTDGALEIIAAEGDTLPIGTVLARIGGANGAVGGVSSPTGTEDGPTAVVVAAAPEPKPAPTQAPAPEPTGERVKASPLARRIARERGVDIAALHGTGPGGRVVRADVESGETRAPAPAPAAPAPPAAAPAETGTAKGDVVRQDLTRTQQVVARRMAESKATVPEFTLTTDVDMEQAVALRAQIKALGVDAPPPSYNDMVVKACALALTEFPRANGAYRDGRFELYSRVNVGVAVAAQDALVVPTVFDADRHSLGEIAATTRALAERVRSGEVTPPELSGGTFTVSNLGMYGVTSFTAVINPPQAAILAVGAMVPRAVPVDGQVVVRNVMPVTLACDHRILYGADAAQFLARIRTLLENPVAL
ncbi:MAG: catalytic domain of component of various dehydrogenase complexe, partial [Solirubrobacterales bacterium]|nr:catalytic domain of component of various dehydrogenase complexe [Solirubrobacterales bacterium]